MIEVLQTSMNFYNINNEWHQNIFKQTKCSGEKLLYSRKLQVAKNKLSTCTYPALKRNLLLLLTLLH